MLITMYNCCSEEKCYVPIWASSRCCHQKITVFTQNMFKTSNSQLPNMCSKTPLCQMFTPCNSKHMANPFCYNGASSVILCLWASKQEHCRRSSGQSIICIIWEDLLLNKEVINLSAQVLIQMAQSHSSDFEEIDTHEVLASSESL